MIQNVNSWEKLKIDDLGEVISGGTPKTGVPRYWNGDINWVTPTDVTALKGKKYISLTARTISEEGLKNSSANMLPVNTLIVCTRATIGDSVINKVPISTNQGFKSLITKPNVFSEFMYYWMLANKNELIKQSSGSTFLELSTKSFKNLKILLPPLPEQQKIAAILSTVDAKIEVIDQQIKETQELKKGLMQRLLTKGIGHTEFKDSPLGEIPKSWEVVKVSDITKGKGVYGINAPAVEYKADLPTYLRITDIDERGRFIDDKNKSVDHPDSNNFYLELGDIVFARTGNTTGKAYLYKEEDGRLVYAGFLIKYSVNKDLYNPHFLKHFVETKQYWDWVKVMSSRSGQPGINEKQYSELKIPKPSLKEQEEIVKVLNLLDNKFLHLEEKKDNYQDLKKGLMQQLLTGKIRVKV